MVHGRLNAEREAMNYAQHELEDTRIQLAEASRSLARSRSEVSFLRELQQQCANLHLELDVTRNKLDNLTELHRQKSSHSKVSVHHQRSVETVDKGLQTVTALPADELPLILPERLPSQDRTMELEMIQSQQQLQQQHHHQYIVDLLRQVQQENQELRGHTQQQRLRIDELTSHAAELANQLEDAHTAITLLSNRPTPEPGPSNPRISATLFHPGSGTVTVPPIRAPSSPPPPPPLPPQDPFLALRAVQQSRRMGAGEVNYISPPLAAQTPSPIPTSSSRSNLYHRREWRKKPPRRLMVHSTTSSDETSPTEEILQEARHRLRRLEVESEAVDRSYQDFRIRHAESLAATASLLFLPIVPSTHQLLSSNLGYGSSITPSQPLYSSATGGSSYRTQTPVYFRSMNFQDTSFPRRTETLFNSSLPRNTFISPIVHTHRIPSTVRFSVGASTQSQYDFPPRLRTPGSVDSTITSFSNRTAMQSHSRGINNTRLTPDTFVITSIAPRTDFMPRTQYQPSTRSDLHYTRAQLLIDDTDSRYRRESLSQTNLMEPHIPSSLEPDHNEARNVTFGSPLTTVTVYNGPQVSSSIDCSTNKSVTQEELNGETASNIPINRDIVTQGSSATIPAATAQLHSPTKSTVSTAQSLLESEAWEDPLIKEIGLPACLVDSSSSAHDDDWNSSQARIQFSGMEFLENKDKYNITRRLSSDNIWKLQHKPSLPSSLIPSLASEPDMKGTKLSSKNSPEATPLKEYKSRESTSVQLETLLAIGNEDKSQTSVTGVLSSHETIPTESFVSNETTTAIGSGTSESDLHAILSSSIMSGTTFSSSIKDPSLKSTSTDGESFIPILKERDEKLLNKQRPDTNIEIPTHDDEVPSEISESVTQTTVKNREIKLNLIGTSKNESVVQKIRINMAETINQATREENMPERDLGIAQLAALLLLKDKPPTDDCLTKTNDQINEAEEKLDSNLTNVNNQGIARKLTEQQTNFQGKNHSGFDLEATSQATNGKEINNSDNGKTFNVFMPSKSRVESELSIAEGTDQDISVGKESKKDDSSNDDFW